MHQEPLPLDASIQRGRVFGPATRQDVWAFGAPQLADCSTARCHGLIGKKDWVFFNDRFEQHDAICNSIQKARKI